MLTRIRELLSPPILDNEEEALAASLLRTVLLVQAASGFFVPLVLNIVALLDPDDEIPFSLSTLVMGLIVPALALGLLQMARRGRVRLASAIITSTIFLLTTSTIASFRGTRDTAAGMYILVIAIAGLLLGGRAAIVFMVLSLIVSLGIYLAEVNGLLTITLSETPEIVEWMIFAVVIFLLGILLRFAFESLGRALRRAREANQELEDIQSSLAERVAARTQDLELAAEIGRSLSHIQESENILLEAVELIRSRFDLYYTQIYLVDTSRNNLVMRAGTGIVGRQLRQLGHRLPINPSSINGTAVISREPVIVANTADSEIFRQNPLLPDTRSEMAIPLIVSDNVIGSLNLQSAKPGGLTEDNLPAYEALAGQLAVALDNARLFTETAETQEALEALAQRLTRSSWDAYLNAIDRQESIAYTYDLPNDEFAEAPIESNGSPSIAVPIRLGNEVLGKIEIVGNEWHMWQQEHQDLAMAVAQRVAQQVENMRLLSETERYRTEAEEATRRLTREGWESYIENQLNQADGYEYDQQEVKPLSGDNGHRKEPGLVQALTIRGESIGQLEIDGVSPEEDESVSELIEAVAERLSAHLENLRLSNQTELALTETERRAEELAVINELARTVAQQLDLEKIIETVYEQVRRVMSADAFIIGLYVPETNMINYPFIYDEGVRYQEGVHYLDKDTSIYKVLKTGRSLIKGYASEAELPTGEVLAKNALGNDTKPSRSMMFVPLSFSNEMVGIVSIQSYQFNAYSEVDLTLVEGIASHVSVAIQNAQLFTQTQQRAEELAVVNRIAQTISQELELEPMLNAIFDEISRILPVDAFIVALYYEESGLLEYPLIFDDGRRYRQLGLRPASPNSMVVKAIRNREPMLLLRTPEEVEAKAKAPTAMVGNVEKVSASLMYVPLFIGKRSTGAVSIQSYIFDAYTAADMALLAGIANHIAVALENARLFKETQIALSETEKQARRLATLNEMGAMLSVATSQNEVFQIACNQAAQLFESHRASIALLSEDGEWLELFTVDGVEGTIARGMKLPVKGTAIGTAVQQKQTITEENMAESEYMDSQKLAQSGLGSALLAPLIAGGRVWGTFNIGSQATEAFNDADRNILRQAAALVASTVESRRLFGETVQRAEELAVINEIAQTVAGKIEQEELLATVYEQVQRIMSVDAFTVTSYDPEEEMIHYLLVMDEGKKFDQEPSPLGIGAISRVLKEGQPVLINRTQEELDELAKERSVVLLGNVQRFSASMVFVPLRVGTEILGGLSAQSYELNAYGQEEVDLLVGVANHVALALENARLFEETQSTLTETELLYNMGAQINRAKTLEDLVNVVSVPGIASGAQSAGLFRFDHDENGEAEWMELAASWLPEGVSVMPVGTRIYLPEIPSSGAQFYTPTEPMLIGDIEEDERLDENARVIFKGLNTRAMAIVPMHQLGVSLGGLVIRWTEPRVFIPRDQRLYESLARQMSTAMSNQLLLTETQERAAQLEKLTQIETALSQAEDETGILDALTSLLEERQAVSLYYAVEEDLPTSIFAVGHWQGDNIQSDDETLYAPFELKIRPGLSLALEQPNRITYVSDMQSDDRVNKSDAKEAEKQGYRSMMIVPLRSGGRWQGFVSIKWANTHEFSDDEIYVWEQLREPLAAIAATRRAYLSQQEALSETALLYETGAQLSVARSYDEVLGVIRRNTILGQDVTNVSLMLFEHDWNQDDKPEYADVLAFWSQTAPDQAKMRFYFDYESSQKILHEASMGPLIIEDVPNSAEIDDHLRNMLVKGFKTDTYVLFPMFVRGEWIGYVNAMYPRRMKLSQQEIRRAEATVQQAGVAVQGLRNLEQASQQTLEAWNRSNELAILNEMGRSLTALVDMDTILDNVYRYTSRLMDAVNFYISFFDMKRDEITFALDIRGERVMRNAGTRKAGKGLTEHIIRTKEPLLIPENVGDKLDELGIERIGPLAASWMGVPMMVGSQVIGVIGLQNWETPRTYNEQHLRLLTSIAGQAAIAIENARLFEQIQARARRERILREVTAKVRGATDADSVMRTAVQEIGRALGRQTFVYLNPNDNQEIVPEREEAYGD